MPMRAYRASRDAFNASTGHAGAHIAGNKIAWILGCIAAAVALFYVDATSNVRGGTVWGDVGAVAAMLVGILFMMMGQEGYEAPEETEEA